MKRSQHPRSSALLEDIANDQSQDEVGFDELLQAFSERAFGVFLLAVTLPAFLPLPVGVGAISGPLVALVGAQLLVGLRRPWVPAGLRRRSIKRASFRAAIRRLNPWLKRIERLCRPRLDSLTNSTAGNATSGGLLVVLGLLLALPLPFTNYPFGLLIFGYAIALIERDGLLMAIAWGLGVLAILASLVLSTSVVALLAGLLL